MALPEEKCLDIEMRFSHFFKKGFLLFLLFAILLLILTGAGIISGHTEDAWVGLGIGLINYLAGAAVLAWGIPREDKIFYGAFFGGMLSRFFLIFLILFVLIKYYHFNELFLVGSLLIAYFGFLMLEIWHIWKFSMMKGTPDDA